MISANIDRQTRRAVYERDGYRCALCDSGSHLQIHHAIPRGRGGDQTSEQNLITLCATCHTQAHGLNLENSPLTQEDIEQAITEYMADLYEPGWWPWRKGYRPW